MAQKTTTTELVQRVARATGSNQSDARAMIDALIEIIATDLNEGAAITLTGLGKLSISDRAARPGRNPATGEAIQIPASRAVKFTAAKALKDAIN